MWDFKQYENQVAVIDDSDASITYSELDELTNLFSNFFNGKKLIFCLCANTLTSLIGYISCLRSGAVPLLLDKTITKSSLEDLIQAYGPNYIWLSVDQSKQLSGKVVFTLMDYCLVEFTSCREHNIHRSLALLLTTSGSTGSPKLVRQSYENILANTHSICEYLQIGPTERAITTLPMQYTYGLSIINTHLYAGATIILTKKTVFEKEFWGKFEKYGATSFGGVPYTYEILNKLMFFRRNLPSLRYMTQAGGKLQPELHKKFAEYAQHAGKKFVVMYGAAEATARMGFLPPENSIKKHGSMGIAIPGGSFSLIDEAGLPIKTPDTIGELEYRGKNVTLGYATNADDLSLGDERCGVLQTGDMAKFDGDGYFYIVGRKKRFLKLYGNRIGLDEVERMIKSYYTNTEVACAGFDDNFHIFITNYDLEAPIKLFVAEKTRINIAAFHVHTLNEIPKNDYGKIQYKELEKYYE